MNDPLGYGNCVEWSDHIYHRAHFDQKQTVEEVHAKMLSLGIDYAAEIDEENIPIGLISLKRLSAALSARYGQALFAKKVIGEALVPSAVLGYMTHLPRDRHTSIVIPISQATVFNPVIDFFTAQACL